jgi:hypothetical protein
MRLRPNAFDNSVNPSPDAIVVHGGLFSPLIVSYPIAGKGLHFGYNSITSKAGREN